MATTEKHKVLKLDFQEIESSFFEESSAFGIKAFEEPYHVAWLLNNIAGTNFIRNTENPSEQNDLFVIYEYYDKNNYVMNYLYTNKREGQVLVNSLKGYNYIWLMQGQDNNRFFYTSEVNKNLKKANKNNWLMSIDLDDCKDKRLLIFE